MTQQTQALERAPGQRLKMSYDEYLAWEHEGGLAEWVEGEVILHMAPTDEHQRVVIFLLQLLGLFVNLFGLGQVRVAPLAMRALPDGPAREPDVFFIAIEHLERLGRRELSGPADLVVEVISDDSVARDRADKFYEYQEAGVREYWIIDPRPGKERADFYHLAPDGKYQAVLPDAEGRYHAAVLPGLWLKLAWLWQTPMPDPLRCMLQIAPEALRAAVRGDDEP